MKKLGGLLGLVIALGVAYYMFKAEFTQGPMGGAPPKQIIDVVGVKNDLLVIAQAERTYMASHGNYASVEQLEQDGALTFSGTNRRGYDYSAEVDDGQHFKITAKPSDPQKQGWPTLVIDDLMQVTQQ